MSIIVPQEINKNCKSYAEVASINVESDETQKLQIKNTVLEAISEHHEKQSRQDNKADDRKKNIIVFNVPESKESDGNKRKEHDAAILINVYENVCGEDLPRENLAQVRRLGAIADKKNRPLLVTVCTEEQKRKLFKTYIS